jgi:hypothetical protein
MNKKQWLKLAGSLSLVVALFQAVIFLFPSAKLYFGAPKGIVENKLLLFVMGEGAARRLSGLQGLLPKPQFEDISREWAVLHLLD